VFCIHILLTFPETKNWIKEFGGKVNEEVAYLEVLISNKEVIFIDTERRMDTVKYSCFCKVKAF
jgi:hypothetical protein